MFLQISNFFFLLKLIKSHPKNLKLILNQHIMSFEIKTDIFRLYIYRAKNGEPMYAAVHPIDPANPNEEIPHIIYMGNTWAYFLWRTALKTYKSLYRSRLRKWKRHINNYKA